MPNLYTLVALVIFVLAVGRRVVLPTIVRASLVDFVQISLSPLFAQSAAIWMFLEWFFT